MTDRKLVVYENDPTTPEGGRLIAIDVGAATGFPIPAFRPTTGIPATGTLLGEGIYDKSTGFSYIWDGTNWKNVVPPSIVSFPTETALLAASAIAGTYAFSVDTGNLFSRMVQGGNLIWRQIGTRTYPTEAALLADNSVADGETAFALDTGNMYLRVAGAWRHGNVEFMTLANAKLATPSAGRIIFSTDTADVLFATGANWHSVAADTYHKAVTYTKVEVDGLINGVVSGLQHGIAVKSIITGATPLPAAPAIGDSYIIDGLATDPVAALHLNNIAVWFGAGTTAPKWVFTAPAIKATHLVEDQTALYNWNGVLWVKVATGSLAANMPEGDFFRVGSMQQSMLTEAQFLATMPITEQGKWVLADGRLIAGTSLANIRGITRIEDLRGAYIRMAGTNTNPKWIGGLLNAYLDWATGLAKNAFTGITNSAGGHVHAMHYGWHGKGGGGSGSLRSDPVATALQISNGSIRMDTSGVHSHTVSINGGGDLETRPQTFTLNYFIKVN